VKPISLAVSAALFGAAVLASGAPTQAADGATELKKILMPHAFFGQRVTPAMKAASGDPNLTVIDRRWQWGEIYSCNYMFQQGRRVLVCD